MEKHYDLAVYRDRLLQNIQSGSTRSACRLSDSVQVFVNQRRMGSLDGSKGEATLQVRTDGRIEDVQLRSEDGVLLGGLSAPDYGVRNSHIRLDRDTVELRVQNYGEGGSVNALFIPAPGLWRSAKNVLSRVASAAAPGGQLLVVPGMRTMAFTQVLLAVLLAGLVAETLSGGNMLDRSPVPPLVTPVQAPWAAPVSEVTKLQQQIAELSNMQTKAVDTIQAQQQGIAQLQRTIAKLSANQESVASGVLTVKQEIEQRRKGAGREVDRLTRMLMSKAQNEQEQLEAEIQSLTVANGKLSKEMSELEERNQDLKKRLKAAGVDVSKAATPARERPMVAQATESSPLPEVAEARPSSPQQPFLFWVSFSDGTSQESIDNWVRDMRGRKGTFADGWQAVEIQPPTEPMERFLDHIKQAKIVKAVRVSR
jgi:hypothetical protein